MRPPWEPLKRSGRRHYGYDEQLSKLCQQSGKWQGCKTLASSHLRDRCVARIARTREFVGVSMSRDIGHGATGCPCAAGVGMVLRRRWEVRTSGSKRFIARALHSRMSAGNIAQKNESTLVEALIRRHENEKRDSGLP